MKHYKYNKLLPLNVRIPFRWRDNISYFTLYQFGHVDIEISNVKDAKLIEYKKNKIKIQFRLEGDIREYRMKFKKKKIPLEYRANVKLIGQVYFYYLVDKYFLENIFILNNDYETCLNELPTYESIMNVSNQNISSNEVNNNLYLNAEIPIRNHTYYTLNETRNYQNYAL
tara:strand:+ start:23 stop:532 length:510 start_codon:yes stop_codon:yes gene_type:complete